MMKKRRVVELGMAVLLLASAFLLSREGARLVSKEAEGKKGVIVVDAGHGGMDPGVVGIKKLEEKEINLKISKKLQKLLEKEGYQVIMTRSEDGGLYDADSRNKKVQDMQKRCELIREKKPLLTVSIHQNSYPDEAVCGPQVFYFTHSAEGGKLAKCIQDAMNSQLDVSRPRVEKANSTYYLLKRSEGILNIVDCGFLSNTKEAGLLETDEYQDKVAEAVRDGILTYLGDAES